MPLPSSDPVVDGLTAEVALEPRDELNPPARAPNAPPKPKRPPPPVVGDGAEPSVVKPVDAADCEAVEEDEEKKEAAPDGTLGFEAKSAVYRGLSLVPTMTK